MSHDKKHPLIYCVDDEHQIRSLITSMLSAINPHWEVHSFGKPEDLIAACDKHVPNLVVADQSMPGMTGTEMLDVIRQKHPEIVRIILSGYALTSERLASAHQYLAKPFNFATLEETIQRAMQAQTRLHNPRFAKLVSGLTSFPALPETCMNLLRALEKDVNSGFITQLMKQDSGVLTRALQLANSPLFRGDTDVRDAAEAFMLLGTRNMRALVLSLHVFQGLEKGNLPEINCENTWQHCCRTANLAQKLGRHYANLEVANNAFFAALVHDLGKLVLMDNFHSKYKEVCKMAILDKTPVETAESIIFGVENTELTGFMLELWGMPEEVVQAVRHHMHPWMHEDETEINATTMVYLANLLAREQNPPDRFVTPEINFEYLDKIGIKEVTIPE